MSPSIPRRLVELACQAPSVHNTQPWIWRVSNNTVRLYADTSRQLPVEDPTGRNLVISCGAALDHFQYAGRALGWETSVTRMPEGSGRDLPLALVRVDRGKPSRTPAEDLEVLRNRCTDRRRFTSWPVPAAMLDSLVGTARSRGAQAGAVVDEAARLRLELLAHQAHALRAEDPIAKREQRQWVGRSGGDGVPVSVLPALDDPRSIPRTRFGAGLVQESRTVVESGDGVIVLGGDVDEPGAWLRTGEALSALWLEATRAGLSVVPLSLPVEIDSVRSDLQRVVLKGDLHPHLLVRIGWQAIGRSQLPRTPRRSVSEVLRP